MAQTLFAVSTAALIVACVAGWAAIPPAKPVLPRRQRVDPFKMMTSAKQMPSEHFADYSFVFN